MAQGHKEISRNRSEGQPPRRRVGSGLWAPGGSLGAEALGTAPNCQNLCPNPEAGSPDPHLGTVTGSKVPVVGIDLDGQDSSDTKEEAGSRVRARMRILSA